MGETPPQCYEAVAENGGERMDVFCARISGETRSCMQRVLAEGGVCCNGTVAKANARLKAGDRVRIVMPAVVQTDLVAQDIPLAIVYEDADIAVIDKPQGMVVHPAPGNPDKTLVNALLYSLHDLSGIGGEMRPGIVHRIDKMTSGLIVVAKNDAAHRALAAQMKTHEAARTYVAIVENNIREDAGVVDGPIGRHPRERKKMAILPGGRPARTHWQVLARYGAFTWIKAELETGRTHQIRVHMASMGHPVAGDTVYGPEKPKLGLTGQALHACKLRLRHPRTDAEMTFYAPLPVWFEAALRRAGYTGEQAPDAWLRAALEEAPHGG